MADVNFIEFSDEARFIERTSPYIEHYKVRGVQLLPNNELPYIQTTNVSGGIELEDWTVYVVDTCGNETDISEYFVIEEIFTDDNGDNQFTWSLTSIPHDFGYELVYLKAIQTIGETFYSNYFMITDYGKDKTCRIDYKSFNKETMQSVQLQMWFAQELKAQELTTYYETSTKNTVVNVVKSQRFENWKTEIISNDLFLKISDIFEYKYTYVNLVRCNLFEAIEIPEFEAAENFYQNIIKITFNKSDVYNPLANPIPIVEEVPTITLSSVVVSGTLAVYTFTYENFTPDYLVYQASQDQVTWGSKNLGVTSPMNTSFNEVGTWYFRISHPLAISNVIELELGSDIDAINDTAQVVKGGTRDINVLFNDVLVGNTLITAVGTATNGTVTIIEGGTKVRYVHDNSSTTSDSFTYTISNGIDTDTAMVNMTIVESSSFLMTFQGDTVKDNVCSFISFATAFTYYYPSTGLAPTIGDRIYNDEFLTSPRTADQERWYKVAGGKVLKLDTQGYIIDIAFC